MRTPGRRVVAGHGDLAEVDMFLSEAHHPLGQLLDFLVVVVPKCHQARDDQRQ